MLFTPFLAAAVLTGAVQAVWVETCSPVGCDVVADNSIYTTPTLWLNASDYKDDVPTTNKTVIIGNNGLKAEVHPFPKGLNMTTTTQAFCRRTGVEDAYVSSENFHLCDKGLYTCFKFPSCYNGQDLDTIDNSHVAFRVNGACPYTHSIQLPDLEVQITYEVNTQAKGDYFFTALDGKLDIDSSTITASFAENWVSPTVQAAAVEDCATKGLTVEDCTPLVHGITDPKEVKVDLKNRANGPFVTARADNAIINGSGSAATKSVVGSYVYNGCWLEVGGFALPDLQWTPKRGLTIEKCVDFCKNGGFGVAGMGTGNQCFCGTDIAKGAVLVDKLQCGIPCSGDPTEDCGGEGRISTYKLG